MSDPRRRIPGVDALLEGQAARTLLDRWPRERVSDALREAASAARRGLGEGTWPHPPEEQAPYVARAREALEAADRPSLRPVVNATGVVLHTNLGRAPLAAEARAALESTLAGYTNLEFDLDEGVRGSRYDHCARLLCELTGAEAALVVNNCAAALVLSMNELARGRGVLVSRGELVEIGGGFRIPDMLERAGADLVEVGSTNRTRVGDYREALDPTGGSPGPVGAILKVHRSNFRISGFTEEASLPELVELSGEGGPPVVHDVGSGLLVPPETLGLPPEPTPAASITAGAHLAVFSADKLLGGPQAGVVVGREALVARLRGNPLCRTFRVDKGTLAALESTLRLYRDPETVRERVPVLAMLTTPLRALEERARGLAGRLEEAAARVGAAIDATVAPGEGRVGGGTYPEHRLPGWTVRLRHPEVAGGVFARHLRHATPAVVGRVEEGALVLDVRTLLPGDDERVVSALAAALTAAEVGK